MATEPGTNETGTTAPATAPSQTRQPKRTTWPLVLGAIALLSGVLAIPTIFHDMSEAVGSAAPAQAGGIANMRAMNLAIRMGLALWLAWGSLDLLRRRSVAGKSLRSWAAIRTFLLSITVIQLVATWFGAVPQAQGSTSSGPVATGFAIWMSAVLPIFVLVWFGRQKIKDEVATWP